MSGSAVETLAAAIRERDAVRSHSARTGKAFVEIGQCLIEEPEAILSDRFSFQLDWKSFDDMKTLAQRLIDAEDKVMSAYMALSDDEREIVPSPIAP
jgi:hypothetical protein